MEGSKPRQITVGATYGEQSNGVDSQLINICVAHDCGCFCEEIDVICVCVVVKQRWKLGRGFWMGVGFG